ncbi:MAG: hypothetical protein JWO38_8295 [Gemmataceae bacterium]|nr:hypothetical protein [Gemmataceae bacterium]
MPCFDIKTSTSIHAMPPSGEHDEAHLQKLDEVIEYSARLLPAEGPIGAFVFQNPLHAFEHLPFTEAVPQAAQMFGCQAFLPEDQYRKELDQGRILISDLRAELEEELGGKSWELVAGLVARLDLRLSLLRSPAVSASTEELAWYLEESEALARFQGDVAVWARDRITADAKRWIIRDLLNSDGVSGGKKEIPPGDPRRAHVLWPLLSVLRPLLHGDDRGVTDQQVDAVWEEVSLRALWRVCRQGVERVPACPPEPPAFPGRHRDLVLDASGVDADALVNDLLIPFCAAYADQGLATWPLPDRGEGFFKAFCRLHRQSAGSPARWQRGLAREATRLDDENIGAMESIHESLDLLGVPEGEWEEFLPATVLALRGWASMLRQLEVRGDRVAIPAPRGTFIEFLAVRLLLERLALAHVAREDLGYGGSLRDLRAHLQGRAGTPTGPALDQRTFVLFRLALILGWCPSYLHGMSAQDWAGLLSEIETFSEPARRRLFHLAYERRYRTRALDAIATYAAREPGRVSAPRFQAAFCIDAREESFRRHLEEVAPDCETFGAAGFFSVPMYYRGAADAHPAALCPIVVRPQHWVGEEVIYPLADSHRQRQKTRRVIGRGAHQFHLGTRGLAVGALTACTGVLATFPLVTRILFPRLSSWLVKFARSFVEPPALTRLVLERTAPTPGPEAGHVGFTVDEMANIGERVLRDIGLTSGFARLVVLLGHGSHCLNNPHKAAYDCGACSGNAGGPNARALAAMLNDPRVREILAARGLPVPGSTVFVGGLHNTAADTITYYDLDLLPKSHLPDFEAARGALDKTCERNAHERCRRFESAPLSASPAQARRHAQERAEDLAQTRPEFGNASNAVCVVGRRGRTRGLFLDRRSFMHSYDPTQDDAEASVLARILSAVVPVCQGINLQYFFSAVDRSGWGCGTKLPHNVTSLLGVMDGARSDLRQGLPWQGVEIHEPLRLLFVIETTPDAMLMIMDRNKMVGRILANGWAQLAVLDPESEELRVFQNGEFHLHHPERSSLPAVRSSQEWYTGRRDNLEFAAVEQDLAAGTDGTTA